MIRIINLPERRDRRREMDHELAALGLRGDNRIEYFAAFKPDDAGAFSSIGARGCYESHLAILREAAQRDASVLILEDDCAFGPLRPDYDFGEGWDIFYGGYYAKRPEDLAGSDIMGSHMMGFSARAAKDIVTYLDGIEYCGTHPPIDAAYIWYRRDHPNVPTYFASPPLAHQRSSRSDVADLSFFDRLPILREVAGLARRVLREIR
jgi:glycosyl transferase, family 25